MLTNEFLKENNIVGFFRVLERNKKVVLLYEYSYKIINNSI